MRKIGFIFAFISSILLFGCSSQNDNQNVPERSAEASDYNKIIPGKSENPRSWTKDYYVYQDKRIDFVLNGNYGYPYEDVQSSQFGLGKKRFYSFIGVSKDGTTKRFALWNADENKRVFDCFNVYNSRRELGLDDDIEISQISKISSCEDKYNLVKKYLAGENVGEAILKDVEEGVEVKRGKYPSIGDDFEYEGYIYTYTFPEFGLRITTPLGYFMLSSNNGYKEKEIKNQIFKKEGNKIIQNVDMYGEDIQNMQNRNDFEYLEIFEKSPQDSIEDVLDNNCQIGKITSVYIIHNFVGASKLYRGTCSDGDFYYFESIDKTKYFKLKDPGACAPGPCRLFEKIEIFK